MTQRWGAASHYAGDEREDDVYDAVILAGNT